MDKTLPLIFVLIVIQLFNNTAQARVISGLEQTDHESSDLPPPAVRLEQPEHRLERAKRYSEEDRPQPNHNGAGSVSQFLTVTLLGATLLLILPIVVTGLLCCKEMGASNGKRTKRTTTHRGESFILDPKTNPMNARADYSHKECDIDRKNSCAKTDSLYRSESFHPLGSPTFSTFGSFAVMETKLEQEPSLGMPRKVKMFASRKLITKCSSEPNLLDECPADLPHTFIGTEPSHVTRLLRESTPHTTNITGSTLSLVPGPSLTHSTQSLTTHTTTLKPVYIIPPEVEKVAVRLSRSPQPTRKPPVPERLNSATSVSSFGSASSGQRHLSESFEPALTMETDQPSPGLRTIARIKEGSPKHVLARDSVTSNMSYVLTQEPQPWTCDSRPCSGEARPPFPLPLTRDSRPCSGEHRPPPPLPWTRDSRPCSGEDRPPPPLPWTRDSKPCSGEDRPPPPLPWTRDSRPCSGEARPTPPLRKVPSPLHIRADTARAAAGDVMTDIKQRALPPTPNQVHARLTRTSATLKTYRSPLLSTDESSLDSHGSREASKQQYEAGASRTLPTKRHGRKLELKSIIQTDCQPHYHVLESSPPSADITVTTMPPPRPPRKLIDPTRQIDFTHLISGENRDPTLGSDDVSVAVSDNDATCLHCGRQIGAEPFYICVADSEDGGSSTRGSATNTPEVTDPVTGPDAVDSATRPDTVPLGDVAGMELADTISAAQETVEVIQTQEAVQPPEAVSDPIISEGDMVALTTEETNHDQDDLSDEDVQPRTSSGIPTGNGDDVSLEDELQPGALICMDCVRREAPIYHELNPGEIEAILSGMDLSAPPIPSREQRPPRERDPVYERIASVKRKLTLKLSTGSRIITRVSLDGAYIIKASKPRRPKYRTTSSTDYEQVSTDIDTPPSPHYHRASEIHQLGEIPLPDEVDPANHTRCRPHPPPLAAFRGHQSSSHDYESLPGSFEGRQVELRGGLGNKQGSHDYAFIGPAPSMESLNERSPSPPYVPPGGQRATLMRIDSQGYASVMIPDYSDDTTDCLRPGERRCPFHVSTESLDPRRSPNDYEVPVIKTTAETEETIRRGSLARQRAVSENEQSQQEVATSRQPDSTSIAQAGISDIVAAKMSVTDNESVESVIDQDGHEEVFDSGFENSNEGLQLTSPRVSESVPPPIPPRPPRALSLIETQSDTLLSQADDSYKRPRSKTFNSSKPSTQETNKKLCIVLNHQSSVVV